MNTQSAEHVETVLNRASVAGWPHVLLRGSISLMSEGTWRRAMEWVTDAELEVCKGAIRAVEIRQEHDRSWQNRFDSERAARESGPTEAEQAELNQMLIEARVAAQDGQRAATKEQVDRLIEVNSRIAAALERK